MAGYIGTKAVALSTTTGTILGDMDVGGVTNLDVVDIDGAVNISAATTIATNNKIQFRDAAIYLNSSADGQLDIVADTEIQIAATTVDINGAIALNGAVTGATNITLSGELDAATGDFSGAVDIAGDLTLSAGGDGALRFSGASSIKMLDNSATSLVFEEADNAYMTFVTTNSSETIRFDKKVAVSCAGEAASMVEINAGDDGAVALSARSNGGNGNNRRFNLIPFASGGTYGGGLKIQTRNTSNAFATTLTLDHAYGATLANGLTLTDGNITVASGHGIDFGATGDASGASAELFNDYEEGTFTPLLSGAKPGGGEVTYSSQIGHYTKIGNVVEFSLSVLANGSTIQSQSNEVLIAGLPFTVENISSQHFPPCSLFCDSGFNQSAATQGYIPVLQNGTTTIKIFGILSAAGSNQNAVLYNQLGTANSAASFAFRIAGTYRV